MKRKAKKSVVKSASLKNLGATHVHKLNTHFKKEKVERTGKEEKHSKVHSTIEYNSPLNLRASNKFNT